MQLQHMLGSNSQTLFATQTQNSNCFLKAPKLRKIKLMNIAKIQYAHQSNTKFNQPNQNRGAAVTRNSNQNTTQTMNTMTLEQEQAAVEYRLAEIEDETSQAHRDHAFEYWYAKHKNGNQTRYYLAKTAFNQAHMLYCQPPKLVKIKPSPSEMFALFAIGVVTGVAISFAAAIYILS